MVILVSLLGGAQACYLHAMATGAERSLRAARPRRGSAAETRERLVAAAAALFNRDGYYGTDSNRIAQRAGYAAGTFYKHFADKREILLAAYERWVTEEWREIGRELQAGGSPGAVAGRIVALVLRLHVRWRGLRASLTALLPADEAVQRFHREQRRRQLELLAAFRRRAGRPPRPPERDAVLLCTLERVCDGIALGELRDLDLRREPTLAILREQVVEALA
jgi:AcrR family transcriptional regulator